MKVSVIGAGIMGSCTAWRLAERGHDVTIYDQFEPGHQMGSSHGRSRIVRKAYPDPRYIEIMLEAYDMWSELEALANVDLLHQCGLLYFGHRDAANMKTMLEGMASLGVRHDVLHGGDLTKRFPELRATPEDVGVWQPEAGWVDAGACTRAALAVALDHGARFVQERVDPSIDGDRVVLCAGPWTPKLVEMPVRVTRQAFTYVRGRLDGPVWIEDGPDNVYGFPSESPSAAGFKMACHVPGRDFDPDAEDRSPEPRDADRVVEFARRRLGIDAPEVIEQGVCLYTTTADEHFRIGRVDERTFVASPCSGHGFKFGPWIGTLMADLVDERVSLDSYPQFAW